MRKRILILLLLSVAIGKANADWVSVNSDEAKTIYADTATAVKKGNLVEMWGLFDFKTAHISDASKSYKSLKFRDEFDCAERKKRNLYISVHSENMGKGDVVNEYSETSKWIQISGVGTMLWNIACRVE